MLRSSQLQLRQFLYAVRELIISPDLHLDFSYRLHMAQLKLHDHLIYDKETQTTTKVGSAY